MQKIRTNLIYPIFIQHQGCPFRCIFCNQFKSTNGTNGVSPFIDSTNGVSPFIDDIKRRDAVCTDEKQRDAVCTFIQKNKTQPKEIAFYGGSFTCLSQDKIIQYFDMYVPIMDEFTYFRLSTRPDAISEEILKILKQYKVNTIELGIQSFDDKVLMVSRRGYSSKVAIDACKMVLNYGFNLSIQFLIGLPEEDLDSIKVNIEILRDITPDYVRLYPLLVIKDTELEEVYKKGNYQPLSLDEAVDRCRLYLDNCIKNDIKVIKIGLHSDIPKENIIAGPFHDRFGELVRNNRSGDLRSPSYRRRPAVD